MSAWGEALYLFWACWLLAMLEIQIEGSQGWAQNLPTWRITTPWVLRLTNGKPITGYHVYLNAFLVVMFHLPFCFVPFSWAAEGKILSFYFLMAFVWDFQWFVWNPAWGVKRFFRENIWWQPKKILGFPLEYYLGCLFSFFSILFLAPQDLSFWTKRLGCLVVLNLLSVVMASRISKLRDRDAII